MPPLVSPVTSGAHRTLRVEESGPCGTRRVHVRPVPAVCMAGPLERQDEVSGSGKPGCGADYREPLGESVAWRFVTPI